MRYSIHLKPVSDSGLGFHLDIVKYLRNKKLTAAFFHEHRVIRFEASNPGIITHLKKLFGSHILCILSDSHGKGLYKRPSQHVTSLVKISDKLTKERGLFGPGATPLTPGQVAKAYNFPKPTADIKNRVVAILELGGGFDASNVLNYCKSMSVAYPRMWQHNFSTGANVSDGADGADGEVSLDIDVVAAVAPGVQILIVFAPNTTNGFIDAISNIATYFKKPDALSISWGQAEDQWDSGAQEAMNNAIKSCVDAGINVFVAAGDNGSSDGETGKHVDFPASSPFSIACGGTKLILNQDGTRKSEVVWNEWLTNEGATGGGISVSGRKVPDIAGNADPSSGYIVNVDGQQSVIGGTSAVAPLMAGLNVLLNSNLSSPVTNLKDVLYANPSVFFDVTSGNNGAYSASVGYDCCTGLGVPDGQRLLAVLKPSLTSKIVKFCKARINF
jgi:kumamolisin